MRAKRIKTPYCLGAWFRVKVHSGPVTGKPTHDLRPKTNFAAMSHEEYMLYVQDCFAGHAKIWTE